jgi:acetolactate synthase-1/3 small subunit
MKHTISILVENRFGAFDRIATMFSGKGFNIRSISIGETEDPEISRMTIVTSGDDKIIEQVVKQLNRLVDTIKVIDLTEQTTVERELALVTINYQKGTRAEVTNICDIFKGKVVDITNKSITLEVTGPPEKIDAVVNILMPYGIKEMARSGTVALKRGDQLKVNKKEII